MHLFIVATPIGNLTDLTERAKDVLQSVPVVFAEDTRVTKKLLDHIGARPQLVRYDEHVRDNRLDSLVAMLQEGDAALVTDAGTPAISDPGSELVRVALEEYGEQLQVVPIPGPSAVIAALSVSGFRSDRFSFWGYPPHKKGRKTFFDKLAIAAEVVVFYESPHRIHKALTELASRQPERSVMVGRELTKKFETIYRGDAGELAEKLQQEKSRGEYVVVVDKPNG